ncbi:hypothetical protein DRO55_00135 [Candidatus Bathyarchaeota archaeon]|nr:MAG: hypothetical protein DRO55_00135 [Candidatus Bathyarchaeota archaeon]
MDKVSIYRFMSAGCNGCDVEILECLVPRYKLGELNVEVVFTPEEANVLAVTGGINVKGMEELKNAYEKLRPPKLVVAVGNCALTMEIFEEGYPMVGPPDRIIPVNLYIPGCPPRPQAIVSAIAEALGAKLEKGEPYWETPEGFRGKHEIDSEKCIGCGACAQVCTADAIDVLDLEGRRVVEVNYGHCSFCAFCQDECPTEAIRLTGEYHLSTTNREEAKVRNEVELLGCSSCGVYFMPKLQVDWALERAIGSIEAYKEFIDEIGEAIRLCPECRRKVENTRNAKRLLAKLSYKIRTAKD